MINYNANNTINEKLKAVIFDLDGVIIDSEPMHAAANAIALKDFGLSMPSDYYLSFAGTTKYHMMEILIERHNLNATASQLCEAADIQNDILFQKDGFAEVPGVCNFIKFLYNSGYKLAVASSSPYKDIYRVLEYFDIKQYFDVILSGNDEAFNPKPEPDIYINATKKLGVSLDEAIAIEDTDTGISSAKAAGLICYGYKGISSKNQTFALADCVINDYNELKANIIGGRATII